MSRSRKVDPALRLTMAEGLVEALSRDKPDAVAVENGRRLLEGDTSLRLGAKSAVHPQPGDIVEVRGRLKALVKELRSELKLEEGPIPASATAPGQPGSPMAAPGYTKKLAAGQVGKPKAKGRGGKAAGRPKPNQGRDGAAANADFEKQHPRGRGGTWIKKGQGTADQPDPTVRQLQTRLGQLGYGTGAADGQFGPLTEQAVKRFQKDNGLKETGVVDDRTTATLRKPKVTAGGADPAVAKLDGKGAAEQAVQAGQEAKKALEKAGVDTSGGGKGGSGRGGSSRSSGSGRGGRSGAGSASASGGSASKEGGAASGAKGAKGKGTVLANGRGMGGKPDNSVRQLQTALDLLGYDLGDAGADGRFGNDTAAAVRKFQKDHGIKPDGKVGPRTLRAMKKEAEGASARARSPVSADEEPITTGGTPGGRMTRKKIQQSLAEREADQARRLEEFLGRGGRTIKFDSTLHPRDREGRFAAVLHSLKAGEAVKLPDGSKVRREGNGWAVRITGRDYDMRVASPAEAAKLTGVANEKRDAPHGMEVRRMAPDGSMRAVRPGGGDGHDPALRELPLKPVKVDGEDWAGKRFRLGGREYEVAGPPAKANPGYVRVRKPGAKGDSTYHDVKIRDIKAALHPQKHIRESMADVTEGFIERLHPRDRMGKWMEKVGEEIQTGKRHHEISKSLGVAGMTGNSFAVGGKTSVPRVGDDVNAIHARVQREWNDSRHGHAEISPKLEALKPGEAVRLHGGRVKVIRTDDGRGKRRYSIEAKGKVIARDIEHDKAVRVAAAVTGFAAEVPDLMTLAGEVVDLVTSVWVAPAESRDSRALVEGAVGALLGEADSKAESDLAPAEVARRKKLAKLMKQGIPREAAEKMCSEAAAKPPAGKKGEPDIPGALKIAQDHFTENGVEPGQAKTMARLTVLQLLHAAWAAIPKAKVSEQEKSVARERLAASFKALGEEAPGAPEEKDSPEDGMDEARAIIESALVR